jgi:type I restriction enzyme S subunit
VTTLEHYAEINPSTTGIDRTSSEDVAFVPMAAVSEEGRLIAQETRSIVEVVKGYTTFARNDVLMAKITPCMENGKAALVSNLATEVGFGSTEFHVLRARPGVDARFLFYLVWNSRFREEAAKHMTGSAGQKRVPASYLKQAKVPLVDPTEQRRIADILDKADAIRRKRKEAIALTEELLRSAFLEMFGDPVTNPKGWSVKPLGELLAFLTSGSRGWAQHYADSGETFLRIQNVRKDLLDLSDVAFVQAPDSAEARRTETKPGDVLLSITADLGRTAVVPASLPRAFINQHLAILRPQGVNAEYLSAFLASEGGQFQINRRNKGGVKAGLNFDDIRSVEVLLPPVAAQEKFATAKRRIRATNAEIERALMLDDNLYNSLVARAFSGELSS